MFQLILTVISISLMAAIAAVTVSYVPTWVTIADQTFNQLREGFTTLEKAFVLYASDHEGSAPAVNASRADGGLRPAFRPYYAFLPRAPSGYAWSYGYTSQSQLNADGYAGNANGGLNWFCMSPTGAGASEGVYRGAKRAQQLFASSQYYLNTNGSAACGRPINTGAPSAFPAPVVVTLFVRYVAGNP